MRFAVRMFTSGCAVVLLALPVALLGASGGQASTPHGLTVPAQVTASTWSTTPLAGSLSSGNASALGVSCTSSVFCLAVGNTSVSGNGVPFSMAWNGTSWSDVSTPSPAGTVDGILNAVSCVTQTMCFGVGSYQTASLSPPLIEQWNGAQWTVLPATTAPNFSSLTGVSCVSANFCMASGWTIFTNTPLVAQWNGSTWTSTSLPAVGGLSSTVLQGISCSTPSSCMAVGYGDGSQMQTFAMFWNGSTWSVTATPNDATLPKSEFNGVSCAGAICTAVGSSYDSTNLSTRINLIGVWNGSSWTRASTPTPALGAGLSAVSCFSATSCTAGGFQNTNSSATTSDTEALTWNGQVWTVVTTPSGGAKSGYDAVDCVTDWACMATGGSELTLEPPTAAMAPIARSGYRFVASDGGIFNYGSGAPFLGSMGGQALNAPIVGMATMPAGDGYYLVASDGGVFNFGSAQFFGSAGSIHLNKPIVGIAVTPDGGGYWLVASDGGIFNYGDAQFYGSMGGQPLNKPIVGMAPTPNGNGYYLVASDGGIFTFPTQGGPPFLGSTGSIALNKPVVGMAVTNAGQYYMVATDGGIFSFPEGPSGPPFFGSTGSIALNKPVIGMALTANGAGYYLGAADGGIFSFPEGPTGPPFYGSRGGQPLNAPIVGMAG